VADVGVDPPECEPTPECLCWADAPDGGPFRRPYHCITPYGEPVEPCDVGNGCQSPGWLCNDLGNGDRGVSWHYGACVSLGICAWLRERESRARCYYEDGTLYETGALAADPCGGADRGTLCGPACGPCQGERVCVGVSERSGIGLCVRGTPADSPDRCGPMHPGCGDGLGCVGFVLPLDVSQAAPESVWHACVQRAECGRLAAQYPDRFRCTE